MPPLPHYYAAFAPPDIAMIIDADAAILTFLRRRAFSPLRAAITFYGSLPITPVLIFHDVLYAEFTLDVTSPCC